MIKKLYNKYITNLKISQARKKQGKSSTKTDYINIYNPMSSIWRSIRQIKEFIIYNYCLDMKFLTLTVEDKYNSLDRDWWKKEIYNYVQRLQTWVDKRYKDYKIRYLYVLEKHKYKPSYHAHIVIISPFIPHYKDNNIWSKKWKYGSITNVQSMANPKAFKIDVIDDGRDSVQVFDNYRAKNPIEDVISATDYVVKYLSKGFYPDEDEDDSADVRHVKGDLYNQNLYFKSHGWLTPKWEKEQDFSPMEFALLEMKMSSSYINFLKRRFKAIISFKKWTMYKVGDVNVEGKMFDIIVPTSNLKAFKDELLNFDSLLQKMGIDKDFG